MKEIPDTAADKLRELRISVLQHIEAVEQLARSLAELIAALSAAETDTRS